MSVMRRRRRSVKLHRPAELSLRDIADPTDQGSAPAEIGAVEAGFRGNKARMSMKTMDHRLVVLTLRSAEPREAINYADMKAGSSPKPGQDMG